MPLNTYLIRLTGIKVAKQESNHPEHSAWYGIPILDKKECALGHNLFTINYNILQCFYIPVKSLIIILLLVKTSPIPVKRTNLQSSL